MVFKLILLILPLILLSCAGNGYAPPVSNPTTYSFDIPYPKEALFNKTVAALRTLGYSARVADAMAGQVQTEPVVFTGRNGECDCGAWYGKPVLSDPATVVRVQLVMTIRDNGIDFDTRFTAEHRGRTGKIDRRPECISAGLLERQVVAAIVSQRAE